MFDNATGNTVTLELTGADAAAFTALLDLAKREGNPLEQLAAQHLADLMSEAVLKAIGPERALDQIDEVLADSDLPDEIRDHVQQIREKIAAMVTTPEPGSTDMSAFEAAMPDEEPD